MFAEQVQVRAAATSERWWRRLYPASFVLAGITALVVRGIMGGCENLGRRPGR